MSAAVLSWAERRRFARISLPPSAGPVTLGLRNGRRPAVRVLDFSPGGVSLPADQVECLTDEAPLSLRVGDRELSCSLAPESSERLRTRSFGSAAPSERVGLALEFHPGHRDEVAELYYHSRFPSLYRRRELAAADIRSLFEESGYLSLRPGLEPNEAWSRAEWSNTLSHEAVFQDADGHALGHISITRAYRNAWIGHEIAMLPRTSDNLRCRRDLYQHFCLWPRLLDGEGTHVFGYYNPKRRFHQQMFEFFASRSETDDCVVVRMERYMPTLGLAGGVAEARDGIEVRALEERDENEVLDLIEHSWPVLARTAFDIGPGTLSQDVLHPAFAGAGVERSRQCLVLRSAGHLVAVLLCEWDQTRLSLFDVLSVAHVFLAPSVEPTDGVAHAVALAARNFYLARGLRVPLLTCPPGTFHRQDLPGFRWAETMGCIVFSARALRAFEAYVELSLDRDQSFYQEHV